jgi:uracil-DNA glycosylase family 4
MISKQDRYEALVRARKSCNRCVGLTNASAEACGQFDSAEIGPWTRWQGDLDSRIMVVGQDWGSLSAFTKQRGLDAPTNPTNQMLRVLLASVGIDVSLPHQDADSKRTGVFFTNAILCLKSGDAQSTVLASWFDNCGDTFLRRQIELVDPRVVVALGDRAFRAILGAFRLTARSFRVEVDAADPISLPNGSALVPVYHCGRRVLNTHRDRETQLSDWRRVANALSESGS